MEITISLEAKVELVSHSVLDQFVRNGAYYAMIVGATASLLLMLSWCLAAGIMARSNAANCVRLADTSEGAERQ